ncbi:hypothetical protein DM01DRAFT_1334802 [Hesseltinella vesiculosa]|uniref:Uncharacterized protein n=1 Tax=Hesseltinella vesiculosa TaxID=101127 RepID=A0A1X2GMD4_9FUNG|nr:hypothetical protein DM01DRAFT_1334802 [Hesseltinella vesiculosa]
MNTSGPTPPPSVNSPKANALTLTPCTHFNNLTLNSSSNIRTKVIPAVEAPSTNFNDRMEKAMFEDDDDDTPEHPNLTMVIGENKIRFDRWFHDDNTPNFDLDEEDEEFLDASPSLRRHKSDPHFDPTNDWFDDVFVDSNDLPSTLPANIPINTNASSDDPNAMDDIDAFFNDENEATEWWTKHYGKMTELQQKLPVDPKLLNRLDAHTIRRPMQLITVVTPTVPKMDQTQEDRAASSVYGPARKKKVIGPNSSGIRFIRSLSPTRTALRKGKEPDTSSQLQQPSSSSSASTSLSSSFASTSSSAASSSSSTKNMLLSPSPSPSPEL